MKEVIAFYPILIDGTITTIILTVLSAVLALFLSFTVGLSRISKFRIIRILAIIYLEFFRGSSALVQMFFIYFVLPMWGIYFDALTAGVIACGCNLGAYGSEVVRGGVLAVGKEQHEAALALNYFRFNIYGAYYKSSNCLNIRTFLSNIGYLFHYCFSSRKNCRLNCEEIF